MTRISRSVLALCCIGLFIAGCSAATPPSTSSQAPVEPSAAPAAAEPTANAPTTAPAADVAPASTGQYREAPLLASLVEQGQLPPVEERLPVRPLVVTPHETVGQYGGTWRSVWRGVSDDANIGNHLRYQRFVRFSGDLGSLEPDLAESWVVSDDAREYTFTLREGLKWSDGEPFTTDDVLFFFEDVLLNEELTPEFPAQLMSGGEPATVAKIDQQTFTIRFSEPYGLFLESFATTNSIAEDWKNSPRHYLQQFLPAYADQEELDAQVREAGLETWQQLYEQKASWLMNPDLPQLTAWVVKVPPDSTERTVWERNPYFYKVDPEGNQLPYIDQVEFTAAPPDVGVLQAIAGEVDLQIRYYNENDFTPLKENEQAGGYRVIPYYSFRGAEYAVLLNQTTADPVLRELFQDKRFRQAVSLAMNRDEVNEIAFLGLAKPRQASFASTSPLYDPEWEQAYAAHDPDRANQLLDELGLTERDAEGFRLRPDGKTLDIIFEFQADQGRPTATEELVRDYLQAVGIKILLRPQERSLYTERRESQEIQMGNWSVGLDPFVAFEEMVPLRPQMATYGTEWYRWFISNGAEGEEPPPELLQVRDLLNLAAATADSEERRRLMGEAAAIHAENLYFIGLVGEAPRAGVIKNTFRNVRTDTPYAPFIPTPAGTMYSEQFFIEQ